MSSKEPAAVSSEAKKKKSETSEPNQLKKSSAASDQAAREAKTQVEKKLRKAEREIKLAEEREANKI